MGIFDTKVFAALALMLMPAPALTIESANPKETGEPYIHAPTGFVFPASVGEFKRVSARAFGPGSDNIGVGYNAETPEYAIVATIFVYPGGGDTATEQACDLAFENRQMNLKQAHPDAQLIERDTIDAPSVAPEQHGRRAVYEFRDNFRGNLQLLRSESLLFCGVGAKWLIAYRVTAPATADYRAKFEAFRHSLAWPRVK